MPNDLKDLAGTAIGVMMESSMESLLLRAFFAARYHGYDFNMVGIPLAVDVGKNPLAFDGEQMRTGYEARRALAKQPDPWLSVPPNLGDIPTWAIDAIKERR